MAHVLPFQRDTGRTSRRYGQEHEQTYLQRAMKTNRIGDQRPRPRDDQTEGGSPGRHPHQITVSGRTNTSELSAITLPSVSDISNAGALHRGGGGGMDGGQLLGAYDSVGEIDIGVDVEHGAGAGESEPLARSSSSANENTDNPHAHAQALHDEAMETAKQERSDASLPSLATTPHRVNDEGQSLLHRGGMDQEQDRLYRSFGTMEDVSGASSCVVIGADKGQRAEAAEGDEISLPDGDYPLAAAADAADNASPDKKKSVGFSDLPTVDYERAKRRKVVRFSLFGSAFANGSDNEGNDDNEEECFLTEDIEKEDEVGRKRRGWSIVRNRQKSIILYGRRVIQQDSNDEEEGCSNGGADDAIFLSERSAQRRESDRKARQREKILERANLARERYEITIADCLIAMACYLGLSVLAFSFIFEHWTIIDSAYFAVITFTACGYGDLTPSTSGGRLFCTFFALGGCAVLGVALGILGDHMIKNEVEKQKQLKVQGQIKVMKSFVAQESSGGSERNLSSLIKSLGGTTDNFLFPAIIFIIASSAFISIKEGWDFVDGLYFVIVTACTIGFGDFTPTSESSRAVAVIFVPFSVACLGAMLARIASAVINKRQQKFRDDLLHFELTPDMLEACDVSSDGRVDKGEYMTFMLLAMKVVDAELLDAISAQFDKLDVTKTGDLRIDDLLAALEKNLQCPKKKLELHRYKQSLLAKGARKKGLGKSMRFG